MPTVSSQFKEQLGQLVSVIGSCHPHYIRCIKPTEEKKPGIFDGMKVGQQLSYSGVLETVQVRCLDLSSKDRLHVRPPPGTQGGLQRPC